MIVTDEWQDLTGFLLQPCDMAVVLSLDKFVSTITSILPKREAEALMTEGRHYTSDKRKFYYQPGRMLGINEQNFYGLNRYTEATSLTDSELSDLAYKVIDAYKTFGIEPTKLSSPVAVFGDALAKVDFPRACDLPNTAFDLLDQSAKIMTREWREVYQIGHWNKGEIFDYDISSAYPSLIANLPDIRIARYFSSNTMPDKYLFKASAGKFWGVLKGRLNITAKVSPFTEDTDLITTEQLWLLNRWKLGTFEMEQGWFLELFGKYSYPLRETMINLYNAKQSQDKLISLIAKGISVGVYGRLAQRYDDGKLGNDFNSIYALLTTSRCAVKVCDFIYRNNMANSTVSVLVDGCLTTKQVSVQNNGMGSWRLNELTPALVLSILYQWLGDKKPNGLTYEEMIDLIKKQPNSSCYGNVDLNLIVEHDGSFPKTGRELLEYKHTSNLLPPSILVHF